jgi:hypothetical protein
MRLALAALVLAGWLGWLLYLVLTTGAAPQGVLRLMTGTAPQVVLRRPQFLVSNLDVLAKIDLSAVEPSEATIQRVLWPSDLVDKYQGKKIKVINLAEFKSDQEKNWAGDYLLPLVRLAENTFEVAPTPRSPGYPPALRPEEKIYPHIYPATQQVLEQYDALHKGEDP